MGLLDLSLVGERRRFFLGELSFVGDLSFVGEPGGVRGGVLGRPSWELFCSAAEKTDRGFFPVILIGDLRLGGEKRMTAFLSSLRSSSESNEVMRLERAGPATCFGIFLVGLGALTGDSVRSITSIVFRAVERSRPASSG